MLPKPEDIQRRQNQTCRNMLLLRLPPETFEQIIHEVVNVAGICSAYRLRGVCRTFASSICYDIFAKRPKGIFQFYPWNHRLLVENCGLYLFYRCKISLDVVGNFPKKIDVMMTYLCQELGITVEKEQEGIRAVLCGRIGKIGREDVIDALWKGARSRLASNIGTELTPEDKLAVAVIYGLDHLVSKLLPLQLEYRKHKAFGFHLCNAALLGHANVFKTISDYLENAKPAPQNLVGVHDGSQNDSSRHEMFEAIHQAVMWSHESKTACLLDWHARYLGSMADDKYSALLYSAVCTNQVGTVNLLLHTPHESHDAGDRVTWKRFLAASRRGHAEIIRYFFEQGHLTLKHPTIAGTYLLSAIHSGHISVVKVILDLAPSIDINTVVDGGQSMSAIDIAVKILSPDIVQCLLDHGAEVPRSSTWTYDHRTYDVLRAALVSKQGLNIPDFNTFMSIPASERDGLYLGA